MATLIEVHNNINQSNPAGGTWVLRWIGEGILGYEDGVYINSFPASFVMYTVYVDGVRQTGAYGGTYDFQGWAAVGAATRSQAFGDVPGVTAGTYIVEVKEAQCSIPGWTWPPPYSYSYADVVIDSEASIGSKVIVVGFPDAPLTPIPADGSTIASWNDTFAWTGDDRIDGPFYYTYPFWASAVAEYYIDSLHTVYFSTNLSYLTNIRRAYSWTDDEYLLRNRNPQYFNLNDYNYVLPYPTSAVTIYWQIKTTNEWGTTWGAVWSFLYDPDYVAPPPDLPTFPPDRPDDYDPDLIWTPPTSPIPGNPNTWEEPGLPYQTTGGGRWGRNLVVAGHGLVYYEDYT